MASTLSAKELPLSKIFSDEYVFTIPGYQRPYSWGVDQAQELLDDLLSHMRDSHGKLEDLSPYFLGSLVLIKRENSPESTVVDGQQRLTTLTLLLACIRSTVDDEAVRRGITKRIYDQGDIVSATENHYRLTLRERDRHFFRDHIQHEGGIEKLVKSEATLPDSQARLQKNARYFIGVLHSLDKSDLVRLVQLVVTRCYLVAVATPDLDSAYRIFGVMNSRGLDLSATDILKAEIIGAIPTASRSAYTEKWEELEDDLGRDGFGDLFSHLRMVYRKAKPKGTLLKEFREHVRPENPAIFVDQVLQPMAQAFREIGDADYASVRLAEAINDSLRWLNRIDFKDWVPPSLAFFVRFRDHPELLDRFLVDLERLTYSMLIRRSGVNERIERFSRLTAAIEAGDDLHLECSALQLSPEEQFVTWAALDGPLYETHPARALGLILLRIDSLVSDGSKTMAHDQVTVEHVMPRNPREKSEWLRWIPNIEDRATWTHRLGNLALLNRKKNSAASNFEFERKKQAYFSRDGSCAFPLTTQVLQKSAWTLPTLQGRQTALLETVSHHWRLQARVEPVRFRRPAGHGIGDSPVFVLGGLDQQLQATAHSIDGQFLVVAGSRARADWVGADGGYQALHQDLIDNGVLAPAVGHTREFLRDTHFSSPSAAAAVIWGRPANGRTNWRLLETGETLAEWEGGASADEDDDDDRSVEAGEARNRKFWSQFLERAARRGELFSRRSTSMHPWIGTSLGRKGFRINVVLTRQEARVALYVRHADDDAGLFDQLRINLVHLEAELGRPLKLVTKPGTQQSRVQTALPGGWSVPEDDWPALQEELVDLAFRLEAVVLPRLGGQRS